MVKKKYDEIFNCDKCELFEICEAYDDIDCIYAKRNNSKNDKSNYSREFFLGIVLTLFGFVLLLPYDTLKSHGYGLLLHVASEGVWGSFCFIVGIFQLYSTFMIKSRFIKILTLSLETFIWSFIGTMFLVNDLAIGNTMNTACTTYLSLAGLALYTARKLG